MLKRAMKKRSDILILEIIYNHIKNNMKKIEKTTLVTLLVFILLGFSSAAMAAALTTKATLLTVVNPQNWGLDNAIAAIVTALVAYLAGQINKKNNKRKKDKDLGL